nr:MAG TPA: hypothetical protein [Bacteriophage sp.]
MHLIDTINKPCIIMVRDKNNLLNIFYLNFTWR